MTIQIKLPNSLTILLNSPEAKNVLSITKANIHTHPTKSFFYLEGIRNSLQNKENFKYNLFNGVLFSSGLHPHAKIISNLMYSVNEMMIFTKDIHEESERIVALYKQQGTLMYTLNLIPDQIKSFQNGILSPNLSLETKKIYFSQVLFLLDSLLNVEISTSKSLSSRFSKDNPFLKHYLPKLNLQ